jgi:hypothetical protein
LQFRSRIAELLEIDSYQFDLTQHVRGKIAQQPEHRGEITSGDDSLIDHLGVNKRC